MTLLERVKAALEKDPFTILSKEQARSHYGFTTEHMQGLGLSRSDLRKLMHKGYVVRGYTKNVWVEGDVLPNKAVVPEGQRFVGPGVRVRWAFITDPSQGGE